MKMSTFHSTMKTTMNSFNLDYQDRQLPQIEDKKFINPKTIAAIKDAKNLTTVEGINKLVDALKQDSKGMSFFLDTVKTIDRDKLPFERWGSRQKS